MFQTRGSEGVDPRFNTPRRWQKTWTADEKARLADMWSSPMQVSQIAERLGRSLASVMHQRKRMKLPGRGKPILAWPEERRAAVAKLWVDGVSVTEISERMGVTRNAIAGVLYRIGEFKNHPRLDKSPQGLAMRHARKLERERQYRNEGRYRRPPKMKRVAIPDQIPDPNCKPIPFLQTTDKTCRWSFNDGTFCGQQKWKGSFCQQHARQAYR